MDYVEDYNRILDKHEINHKHVDFVRFQVTYWRDVKIARIMLLFKIAHLLLLYALEYWVYVALIAAPPVLVLLFRQQIGF